MAAGEWGLTTPGDALRLVRWHFHWHADRGVRVPGADGAFRAHRPSGRTSANSAGLGMLADPMGGFGGLGALLSAALELERRGLAGDEVLKVFGLVGVHAVVDVGEFFFGAFDGGCGLIFVDLIFAEGAVGEDFAD